MHAVNAARKCPLIGAVLRAQTGPPGRGRITGLGVCVWAAGAGALRPGLKLFSLLEWHMGL